MKKNVFHMQGFSDKETLLMKTSVIPKAVVRKTLCQFYLAETYTDLMTDAELQVFSDVCDKLEEHHIVPVGTLDSTYKGMEKKRRDDKKNVFNSPLNFIYITKDSNQKISNHQVEYYVKYCNDNSVYDLHIDINGKKEINELNLAEILEKRFGSVKADVEKRVNMYL